MRWAKFVSGSSSATLVTLSMKGGEFRISVLEDRWNDWPYPHRMEYMIGGSWTTAPGTSVVSLATLGEGFVAHTNNITLFDYTTVVEDDLFYAVATTTFQVLHGSNSPDAVVLEEKSASGGPFGVMHSSSTIACFVKEAYKIEVRRTEEGKACLLWPRFPAKWSVTSDGTDILRGLSIVQTTLFENEPTLHESL